MENHGTELEPAYRVPANVAPTTGRWIGFAAMIVSAVAFGGLAVFARLAYDSGAAPITVLFLRFSLAALMMAGLMRARRLAMPRGRTLLGLIGMGAIGYVGQSLSFFTALTMASAGLVALLLYLYPMLVTIFSVVLFKERLTRVKAAALAAAVAGTALTIGPVGGGRPLGIALGVLAAVIYATYILVGSRVTPAAGPIPASTVIIASAAAVYGALMAAQGPVFPKTTLGWLAVGGVALVSTVIAIVFFFIGLERIGPTAASTISALEPLVTV
ncbi:MAG TPA: EamA family transporter, partial [Herpetosiphonaceae bacterium]|nr:EamA family transporter [Herpetosiphonaceae bacterium]